jgi:hypothetical protein
MFYRAGDRDEHFPCRMAPSSASLLSSRSGNSHHGFRLDFRLTSLPTREKKQLWRTAVFARNVSEKVQVCERGILIAEPVFAVLILAQGVSAKLKSKFHRIIRLVYRSLWSCKRKMG